MSAHTLYRRYRPAHTAYYNVYNVTLFVMRAGVLVQEKPAAGVALRLRLAEVAHMLVRVMRQEAATAAEAAA